MVMAETQARPVGKTKDVGWQIGARRTFPIALEDAWALLTSPAGIAIWLGNDVTLGPTKGAEYGLLDGTTGEMRVFKPDSHLRLTWHPLGWPRSSTIQVRVVPTNPDKTVVIFHQENMPGPQEREDRRAFFHAALDALEDLISTG